MLALFAMLYPDQHPYGRPSKGSVDSVSRIERTDLVEFHDARFAPASTTAIDRRRCRARAGGRRSRARLRAVAKISGRRTSRCRIRRRIDRAQERVIPMMNKAQADIGYGFTTIVRSDPRYYAYTLMNNALGQYGIGGRLGDSIRERQGMAYYAFSSFDANVVEGPLIVRVGVNPANVDRAIASIDEEMRRMATEGMTARGARRLQAVFDRIHSAAARDQRRDCDVSADGGVLRARARPRSPAAVAARCRDARGRERRRASRRSTSTAPQSSSPVRIEAMTQ